jgi:cytochrome c oxidase subunit 3
MYLHSYKYSGIKMHIGFALLLFFIGRWFLDIIHESTFEGYHTLTVQNGLRFGMVLFIVSEIFFFFSFFWAFFHSSVHPTIAIGCVWPPKNIQVLDPLSIPLLNTLLLLSSGIMLTYAHRALVCGFKAKTLDGLTGTICYGIIFTIFQAIEYTYAAFSINDSLYGSLFFMCTGFFNVKCYNKNVFFIFNNFLIKNS